MGENIMNLGQQVRRSCLKMSFIFSSGGQSFRQSKTVWAILGSYEEYLVGIIINSGQQFRSRSRFSITVHKWNICKQYKPGIAANRSVLSGVN